MANNLSAFNPTLMAATIQEVLHKAYVGKEIASYGLESQLTYGATIDRPYIGTLVANEYDDSTGVTDQDLVPTGETLTVNHEKEATFYVQRKDLIQNKFDTAKRYAEEAAHAHRNAMDAAILAEVANAVSANLMTAGSLSGGSGTGAITVALANVIEIFTTAYQKLSEQNVRDDGDLFAVVTPAFFNIIQQKATSVGFNTADAVLKNGKVGRWMNFDIYVSNNVYTTGGSYYQMFGKKGAVDMVVQNEVEVMPKDVPNKTGKRYLTYSLWGIKTFNTGTKKIVSVKTTA